MQNFISMFQQGNTTGRMMTKNELINAVRQDIMGELYAINQYSEHINSTDDMKAKKVWEDIMNEEKVHVGQLFELLFYLDPSSAEKFLQGQKEAREQMGITPQMPQKPQVPQPPTTPQARK